MESLWDKVEGILFTQKAAEKALEIRAGDGIADSQFLRISIKGGGCGGFVYDLYFDDKKDIDKEFEFYGLKVCIDPFSYQHIQGTTINYVENIMESGFKFSNPNAKNTCGCGHSFNPE